MSITWSKNLVRDNQFDQSGDGCLFEASFQETSGRVSVKSNGLLGPAIRVEPGINLLSPRYPGLIADIGTSDFDINGLSREQIDAILLNRQIPEGEYQLACGHLMRWGSRCLTLHRDVLNSGYLSGAATDHDAFDGQVLDTLDPTIQVAWTQVLMIRSANADPLYSQDPGSDRAKY
ncbi:MAG: hypothetical protein H6561_19370 [Lewinellaceae bacterium]|nr:hypothetical protein [Lewinellaceae bacterium]